MLGLTPYAWITLGVIVLMLYLFFFTKVKNDVVFLVAMTIFLVSGTLSTKQTFSGFVSSASLVVVFLGVIGTAMQKTHLVQWTMDKLLQRAKSDKGVLWRLLLLSAALSMFITNSVLGVLTYLSVDKWAKRVSSDKFQVSSSKLLLPIAFAIGLGGNMTIIGSSQGMLWSEVYTSMTNQEVSLFAPFGLGLMCTVACLIPIYFMRNRLPEMKDSPEIPNSTDLEFPHYSWRTIFSGLIMLVVILLSVFQVINIVTGSVVGAMIVAFSGCVSHEDAWGGISWATVTAIAGAKALCTALTTSGLADAISYGISAMCGGGVFISLAVLVGAALISSQLIKGNAVISMILPVAIATAVQEGVSPFPFALAVFITTGAQFCSSFCSAHMILVADQGKYTEKEIFRYGWPLFIVAFITILLGTLLYL